VRVDCSDGHQRSAGMRRAAGTVRRGGLVVMPTDTVYGIAADAFTPAAVTRLLAAKGRGRDMPVPVLIGSLRALDGIAAQLTVQARALAQACWPGGLTLVVRQQPSLTWDLGDTAGSVAVRQPLHPVALELLKRTGPLAVSSANRSGMPAALSAAEAEDQLGDSVEVYLDGGRCAAGVPSSIVDVTGAVPVLLRAGEVPAELIREVVGDLVEP
jgi:L-threonylcarbamoyladenylate synthase